MSDSDRHGKFIYTLLAAAAFFASVAIIWGMLLQTFSVKDERYSNYQKQAESYKEYASENVAEACIGVTNSPSIFRACIEQKIQAYEANKPANEDLRAQQDMALWALWVVVFSVATTGVSVVGIYFIRETLLATQSAVGEAAKATAAAESAVAETTRIGEAQVRAYLSISKASFTSEPNRFGVLLYVKNSAPTPAKRVSIRCDLMTYKGPTADSDTTGGIIQHGTSISQEVPAADTEKIALFWYYDKLDKIYRERLYRTEPMAVATIDIEWFDVFNEKQIVRYFMNAIPGKIAGTEPVLFKGDFIVNRVFTFEQGSS